jgi:hypothetical protein
MITRRTALAGVAALSLSRRVRAEATEQRSVNSVACIVWNPLVDCADASNASLRGAK